MNRIFATLTILLLTAGVSLTILLVPGTEADSEAVVKMAKQSQEDVLQYDYKYLDRGGSKFEGPMSISWLDPTSLLFANGSSLQANVFNKIFFSENLTIVEAEFLDPETGLRVGRSGMSESQGQTAPSVDEVPILRFDTRLENSVISSFAPKSPCLSLGVKEFYVGMSIEVNCDLVGNINLTMDNYGVFGSETEDYSVAFVVQSDIPYPTEITINDHSRGESISIVLTHVELGETPFSAKSNWSESVEIEKILTPKWLINDFQGIQIGLREAHEFLALVDDKINAQDQIQSAWKNYMDVEGISRDTWRIAYESGEHRELESAEHDLADFAPRGYKIEEGNFLNLPSPAPRETITTESLANLWQYQFSTALELTGANVQAICNGGLCEQGYVDTWLHGNVVGLTPSGTLSIDWWGMRWSPGTLSFYSSAFESATGPMVVSSEHQPANSPPQKSEYKQSAAAGVAGVGTLAGLLYFLKPALVGLFSREVNDPLEHPARASIMATVQASPGVHFQEIRRQTKLAAGTTQHHIRMLENSKQLVQEKALGKSCYFPKDRRGRQERLQQIARQDEKLSTILDAVRSGPQTMSILAEKLQVSASTANHHVAKLQDLQLVRLEKIGRTTWVNAS